MMEPKRERLTLTFICLFFGVLVATPAQGFKVDTHIFVAQQIIRDLEDDQKLKIQINNVSHDFTVDKSIVDAILNNKETFRIGSIGPDAFPDIISGQTVVHPGTEDLGGWGTGDWLNWVISRANLPMEKSFAYGYMVHAAADVFAHTYVNQYSGSVFELLDDETDVETRHVLLENYISKKTPVLRGHQEESLGRAFQTISVGGKLAIPLEFIVDTLIFSDPLNIRYSDKFPLLREANKLRNNLTDAEVEAKRIHDELLALYVKTKSGMELTQKDLDTLRKLKAEAENTANSLLDFLKGLQAAIAGLRLDLGGVGVNTLKKTIAAGIRAHELQSMVLQAGDDIRREALKYLSTCEGVPQIRKPMICDPGCQLTIKEANKARDEAIAACKSSVGKQLTSAIAKLNEIDLRSRIEIGSIKPEIMKAIDALHQIYFVHVNAETEIFNAIVDHVNNSINASLEKHFRKWREDVEASMHELVLANGQAIANSITLGDKPIEPLKDQAVIANAITPGQKPIEPLKEWVKCHALPLVASHREDIEHACKLINYVRKIKEALDELKKQREELIVKDTKHIPMVGDIVAKINELNLAVEGHIEKAKTTITDSTIEMVAGKEMAKFLELLQDEAGTTEATLNTEFSRPETKKQLLEISDAGQRVQAEMHINTADGSFNPEEYAVVYNAILLSKLALLDHNELNRLAALAGYQGSPAGTYGPLLYPGSPTNKSRNVLIGSIRSIDGNHQWLQLAMPYPRSYGHVHPTFGRYTYVKDDQIPGTQENGFRLWVDVQARRKVFRSLFKGPLVPGVDSPEVIGFSKVLSSSYPYWVCATNPFPDDNVATDPDTMVDKACETFTGRLPR